MKTSGKKKSFQIGTAFWIAAIAMGGRASGSMTDHMIRGSEAPSMRAASSSSAGSVRRKPRHDEHRRWQADRRIGDDEAPAAVEEAEIAQQDEERDDRELQGQHQARRGRTAG